MQTIGLIVIAVMLIGSIGGAIYEFYRASLLQKQLDDIAKNA